MIFEQNDNCCSACFPSSWDATDFFFMLNNVYKMKTPFNFKFSLITLLALQKIYTSTYIYTNMRKQYVFPFYCTIKAIVIYIHFGISENFTFYCHKYFPILQQISFSKICFFPRKCIILFIEKATN